MGLHTTIFPHSSFHTDDKETKDATAADGSIGRNGCPCALWWKCPFPPHLSKTHPLYLLLQYWAAFSSGFTQPPPNPKHICSLFSKVPRKGLFVVIYNGTVGWKMCFTRNEQAAWFCNAFAKFARFVRHHFVLGSTHASTLRCCNSTTWPDQTKKDWSTDKKTLKLGPDQIAQLCIQTGCDKIWFSLPKMLFNYFAELKLV